MGILDELNENTINYIIHEHGTIIIEGYGYVGFHDLIGIMSDENPSKTLEILKKLTTVALNCIDDVSDRSLLSYVDNIEILGFLISKLSKHTICHIDDERETALIRIINREKLEKAKFILNNLPDHIIEGLLYDDSELRVASSGRNTLHFAVQSNMKEICELLITKIKQKDLGAEDWYAETALHYAIRHGYTDIATLLIDKMDSNALNAKNEDGETALHLAIGKSNIEICKLLVPKMSLDGLTCCPDYSERDPYEHASKEMLYDIRDLIHNRVRNLKYPKKNA